MTNSFFLAQEELLDHARHSQYKRNLSDASAVWEEHNPLCGDRVKVYVMCDKEGTIIERMTFEGEGCVVSQAAASILSEYASRKQSEFIRQMNRADMEKLIGTPLSPSRVKCGMLALVALKHAVDNL